MTTTTATVFTQAGAVFGAPASDQGTDLQLANQPAVLVVAVATVGKHTSER